MNSNPSPPVLEIFVFHSLRLTTEAWYDIADRYDQFLNFNDLVTGQSRNWYSPTHNRQSWPDTSHDYSGDRVHQLLADPVPHLISKRVDRSQHVDQFNLSSFAHTGRLRLTARSYALAINRHKQCMLIFHFAFDSNSNEALDDLALAEEIATISQDRRVYQNISQLDYAKKAVSDATKEICGSFGEACASLRSDGPIVLAEDGYAFPVFVCDSVDPKVASIFNQEENVSLETSVPIYFGWDYGLVCGQNERIVNNSLAAFVFMQFSYHHLRQYEGFLDREMARTSLRSKNIETERAATIVGNLTHTFEWFHLDFFRHIGTLPPPYPYDCRRTA